MKDDEHTLLTYEAVPLERGDQRGVRVTWPAPDSGTQTAVFHKAFRIGRDRRCQVRLHDALVSRYHTRVYPRGDGWFVRDLKSRHGTFMNGAQIGDVALPSDASLQFRRGGPVVSIEVLGPRLNSVTRIVDHYFGDRPRLGQGDYTRMVRVAFERATRRQTRRLWIAIGVVALLFLGTAGLALHQRSKLAQARSLAVEIFYSMQEARLQIAELEQQIEASGERQHLVAVGERQERLRHMQVQYDKLLEQVGLDYDAMSARERHVYRLARVFGECELAMPGDFVEEVERYIAKWRTTSRLVTAIRRAEENDYPRAIAAELVRNNLPPQFFYLALQESDFDARAVGIRTRFGVAKGMWQLIPDTALRYGLETGPLLELRRFDDKDQRFDAGAATRAAARYLRDIYNTDAQASGLLVLASYNWGPGNVRRLLRQLPQDPRERNFWKLLERHQVPQQTYDFVFYIFSAAVIGEEPALFGFDFQNPLGNLEAEEEGEAL